MRSRSLNTRPTQLPGETVDAVAGEADVGLAIRDALATFPADEIVVAVRPDEEEGFLESSATDTAPQHRIEGVPVRLVVIAGLASLFRATRFFLGRLFWLRAIRRNTSPIFANPGNSALAWASVRECHLN